MGLFSTLVLSLFYDESPSQPREFDRITKYNFLSDSQLMFREYLMSVQKCPSSKITSGSTLGSILCTAYAYAVPAQCLLN